MKHWGDGQCNKNLGNAFVLVWRLGDEGTLSDLLFKKRISSSNNLHASGREHKHVPFIKSPSTLSNDSSHLRQFNGQTSPLNVEISKLNYSMQNGVTIDNTKRKFEKIDLRRVPGVDIIADKALISYLKIIADINRSKEILKYRIEPRLTYNGSEEFKVRMGFGLHAGFAIEGAVGTLHKV